MPKMVNIDHIYCMRWITWSSRSISCAGMPDHLDHCLVAGSIFNFKPIYIIFHSTIRHFGNWTIFGLIPDFRKTKLTKTNKQKSSPHKNVTFDIKIIARFSASKYRRTDVRDSSLSKSLFAAFWCDLPLIFWCFLAWWVHGFSETLDPNSAPQSSHLCFLQYSEFWQK